MKNIYLLHTETPSRLFIDLKGKLMFNTDWTEIPIGRINQYIYITSDEKPKDGDWCFNPKTNKTTKVGHHGHYGYSSKKIILTIDPDLIKEGVQDIKNEFLEWFVKNPSCEWVEVEIKPMFPMYSTFIESIDNPPFYGNLKRTITIPQEEPKQKKDLAYWKANAEEDYIKVPISVLRYITELEKRMYSEEDLLSAFEAGMMFIGEDKGSFREWFEQFKNK